MANTKISQAFNKPVLEATDMIPVAAQGALTAYHVTGQALFDSLPAATTASQGTVELATAAETKAGTDTERAVTPAGLIGSIGPKMVAEGMHYIGNVGNPPLTAMQIANQFNTTVGRWVANGDVVIFSDNSGGFYFTVFHSAAGRFYGFNLRDGSFVNIV
jgi:hypothetical protein